jgi:hypothetical protein
VYAGAVEIEPVSAYRTITIPVDLGEEMRDIVIPFTVELMERVEETLQKTAVWEFRWFRIRKGDHTVREAYEEFCRPYLTGIDLMKVQPTFCALFFSRVRAELLRSIGELVTSTTPTEG